MDDVQSLLDSAKEESYLFLVDSRMRDPAVHPTPSEYEIAFSSPFRNVFGLDLLDATIARTEYIVESNTNVLEYALGQPASLEDWNQGAWAVGRKRTVTLDPGDYNISQFVEHVNSKLESTAIASNESQLKCSTLTNPAEINNRIALTSSVPFTLLMASSTLRQTLGFGDPVTTNTSTDFAAVPGWSVNRTAGASDAFLSVPSVLPDTDPTSAALGPVPAGSMVQYIDTNARQHFTSATSGPVTQVLAYVVGLSGGAPAAAVSIRRTSDSTLMASGTLTTVMDSPNDVYISVICEMTPAYTGSILNAGEEYYADFQTISGSLGLYYNQDNLPVTGTRYISINGSVVFPGNNLCVDVITASYGHAARCPGVVNLSGPRYVNIRCPDIESHMFRDRVNEVCHAGLGMVKLRGYGFREQRYDFVSFPPRRFHPLGKLTKLSFRLERPDGSLYDSHGVDHTLLLVLRYYTLPNKARAAQSHSSLNPGYSPDLMRVMHERWTAEAKATDYTSKRYGP